MNSDRRTRAERCRAIELLVLDVDGVLTAGAITYQDIGGEFKSFHVRDGAAIKCWHGTGKKAAILTSRTSKAVERRAKELGVNHVLQGAEDKSLGFRGLLEDIRLSAEQVCAVGDDLADVPVLQQCGLAIAVADACPEALATAHYITRLNGGCGAVREAIELILHCQGTWPGCESRDVTT
jgi:3-deoxy-D-manno-octulosonate 8-phosphate phosphatase (KDO 8-P phosphatase)